MIRFWGFCWPPFWIKVKNEAKNAKLIEPRVPTEPSEMFGVDTLKKKVEVGH